MKIWYLDYKISTCDPFFALLFCLSISEMGDKVEGIWASNLDSSVEEDLSTEMGDRSKELTVNLPLSSEHLLDEEDSSFPIFLIGELKLLVSMIPECRSGEVWVDFASFRPSEVFTNFRRRSTSALKLVTSSSKRFTQSEDGGSRFSFPGWSDGGSWVAQ